KTFTETFNLFCERIIRKKSKANKKFIIHQGPPSELRSNVISSILSPERIQHNEKGGREKALSSMSFILQGQNGLQNQVPLQYEEVDCISPFCQNGRPIQF